MSACLGEAFNIAAESGKEAARLHFAVFEIMNIKMYKEKEREFMRINKKMGFHFNFPGSFFFSLHVSSLNFWMQFIAFFFRTFIITIVACVRVVRERSFDVRKLNFDELINFHRLCRPFSVDKTIWLGKTTAHAQFHSVQKHVFPFSY